MRGRNVNRVFVPPVEFSSQEFFEMREVRVSQPSFTSSLIPIFRAQLS